MDFQLTTEQAAIQKMVHEFMENDVRPVTARSDETGEPDLRVVAKAGELGLMGMQVPAEWGGAGIDCVSASLAGEELSRVDRSYAGIIGAHNTLACGPLAEFGTEDQKETFLRPLAQGKHIGCYGLTEPHAGSDPASMKTHASPDGNEWVINGGKVFISNARISNTIILFARSNEAPGAKGISAFIIPTTTDGVTVGPDMKKLGLRAQPTNEIFFDNVRVPKENILGADGDGFKIAMTTLDAGRISVGAGATGVIRACREESTAYAKERKQFGRPIADNQAIQWKIADMATAEEAARLLYLKAAVMKDRGERYTHEASIAKLFASEQAMKAAVENVQIHGGNGFMMESNAQRHMRDIKVYEIFEGTSEVQRMVIARNLLGA